MVTVPVDDDGTPLEERNSKGNFLSARDGDDLLCPFECDFCGFERLTKRRAETLQTSDTPLMTCIRRAKLDAFWSRRPRTVEKTRRNFLYHVENCRLMGIEPFFCKPLNIPESHDDGLQYAVTMLCKSQEKGRHQATLKFSSVRVMRSMVTNVEASLKGLSVTDEETRSRLSKTNQGKGSGESLWMRRFMAGLEARMGVTLKQDMAITAEMVVEILQQCNEEWLMGLQMGDIVQCRSVAEEACFFVFTYAGGMRSFEVMKITLGRFRDQFDDGKKQGLPPYMGIPMSGLFKSRGGTARNMVIFMVEETKSGVRSGLWVRRLLDALEWNGITTGWMFQEEDGKQMDTGRFREPFYERLHRAQEAEPHLFPAGLDIDESFGPTRSGRRGADTRLVGRIKARHLIDAFFRWNTGGNETSSLPMHLLYADKRQLAPQFVKVSWEL